MKKWNKTERFDIEAAIYNDKARKILPNIDDKDLVVDSESFPFPNREHVEFITYALDYLGDVEGKTLLDCGCGTGASSVYFAKKGANVIGVDISAENIRICKRRAKVNHVEDNMEFISKPIELLDFEDQHFDLFFGNQILHHLDREGASANLRRLLKSGGKGVFCEPALFLNKRLYQLRNSKLGKTLIPHRVETPTESSISMEDLQIARKYFKKVDYHGFHVLARLTNWVKMSDEIYNKVLRFDSYILKKLTLTRRLVHFIVLKLE